MLNSETKKIRVAVVDSHPIQYHYKYFQLLAAQPNIELHVFYCWDTREGVEDPSYGKVKWDLPLLEDYEYSFVPNRASRPGFHFFGQINPSLIGWISKRNYDVVWVWGYSNVAAWLAVITAKLRGVRVLFRGEATLKSPKSKVKQLIKFAVVRSFMKMVDGVAYSCEANKRYYEHYGVPDEKFLFVPCAVDNQFFRHSVRTLNRLECRRSLGLNNGAVMLLFVGRLNAVKRPMDIISAVEKLATEGVNIQLIMVGDGALRAELETYCDSRNLSQVRFEGFRNQGELSAYYLAADVVVLASRSDPSPKFINEAFNFGLPAVVSDRLGTAGDLVRDGYNGLVYPCGDVDALLARLKRLIDTEERKTLGQNALETVNQWSYEAGHDAIKQWLQGQEA